MPGFHAWMSYLCDAFRHLTVQGEMTWNPKLQRWEGNEAALRDFDKAMATSTRPALITQLSTGLSPARSSHTIADSATLLAVESVLQRGSSGSTSSSSNVKVVGSMVFDPSTMSWHSIASDGEDELDLAFEGSDWADDEGDEADGWERGERERMLKNRASFVRSEASESEAGDESAGRQALIESCRAGERRHRAEMACWVRKEYDGEEEDMREQLYDIRKVSTRAVS